MHRYHSHEAGLASTTPIALLSLTASLESNVQLVL
jgi:hypothetical protein